MARYEDLPRCLFLSVPAAAAAASPPRTGLKQGCGGQLSDATIFSILAVLSSVARGGHEIQGFKESDRNAAC